MRRFITLLLGITIFMASLPARGLDSSARQQLHDSYEQLLSSSASARDSIRILYNMFDLSARKGQIRHAWEMLDLADRAEDTATKIDMLRTLGTFFPGNDSVVEILLRKTDEIPNRHSRASTRTYILNQHFSRKNRKINNPELQVALLDSIMKSHDLKGDDIYDELSVIYQIIQFLGVDAEGVLFRESLETYEELIDRLPLSDYPLKSQFNTTSAMIHSRLNGNVEKAIEADRDMLALIDQLQEMYRKHGRRYRNYDPNKFICYRRMLSNYEGLTREELDEIHDSILAICDRDFDIQTTVRRDGHPSGFYYMAIQDYSRAIPLLKSMFGAPYLTSYQRQKYYWMLMTASKETGDRETYMDAMENFIKSSMEIDSTKTFAIKKEIMVRDSILPTPLLSDVANHSKHSAGQPHTNRESFMILSAVLALLLTVYMTLYFRLRLKLSVR